MGVIDTAIFSKGFDLVLEIGITAAKNRIKSAIDQRKIKEKLEDFLSRKLKENWFCTRDEEIDFEGLANYILTDLIEDVEIRLFGETEARNNARKQILSKSEVYAQAHTKIAKDRAKRIVTSVITSLKIFYREKVSNDLLLVEGEIIDDISSHQEQQTQKVIDKIEETGKEISKDIAKSTLLSIDTNINLIQEGKYAEAEKNVASAMQAIGTQHPLYPYYRVGFHTVNGKDEAFSCPLTDDMPEKYRPKLELGVYATLGGKEVSEFNTSNLDYSFRHQIPFEVNVVEARKLLGSSLDPYQHEAEREIGKHHKIFPPEFPPAFTCKLLGDSEIIVEYLLLRTEEILDDGTFVVTNREQYRAPFKAEFHLNVQKKIFHFHIEPINHTNSEQLLIAKTIKAMSESTKIELYSMEHSVALVTGNMQPNSCQPMFDSIDEDIEFLENIIEIEKYFNTTIKIPNPIRQRDVDNIAYISSLIRGDVCEGTWSELTAEFEISQKMKESMESDDASHEFCFVEYGTVSIDLWDRLYEIPVKRTFPYIKIKDWDRVKKKIQVLDLSDPIKIVYVPGSSGNIMRDQLDKKQVIK